MASQLFPDQSYHENKPETVEVAYAYAMGRGLLEAIHSLDPAQIAAAPWDDYYRTRELEGILASLNRQHQWRIDWKAGAAWDIGDYRELVADAFLAALESECPEPEWLPRV